MDAVLVPFHGDEIEAFWDEDSQEAPVSISSLSRNMGLDPKGQRRKVLAHHVLSKHLSRDMMSQESERGDRENLTIPLRYVATWMTTIVPGRARPEIRPKLIAYKEEAADVLAQHCFGIAPPVKNSRHPYSTRGCHMLRLYGVVRILRLRLYQGAGAHRGRSPGVSGFGCHTRASAWAYTSWAGVR